METQVVSYPGPGFFAVASGPGDATFSCDIGCDWEVHPLAWTVDNTKRGHPCPQGTSQSITLDTGETLFVRFRSTGKLTLTATNPEV